MSPVEFEDHVLYEDNHLLILNKINGLPAAGDPGTVCMRSLAKDYIKTKYNKPGDAFLENVHRLDQPVTGVLAMSRTSKALARMNKLFKDRDVEKTYLAIVDNAPPKASDTLTGWLIKDRQKNRSSLFSDEKKGSKYCELTYRLLGRLPGGKFLVEVTPRTGRPHQIRVQLAEAGAPITGDLRYGNEPPNPDKSICLHAYSLRFIHPVRKEELNVVAPLPGLQIWQQAKTFL